MYTTYTPIGVVGVLLATIIYFNVAIPHAQAQLISNEQVTEQKRVVLLELVGVLEQHVKLLQMLYIQRLEARVADLQTEVDAQS